MRSLGLLSLLCASCGAPSGLLVVSSWDSSVAAQSLSVETTVGAEAPTTRGLPGPMASPYRLLVRSPAGKPLIVKVEALDASGHVVAAGRVGVTPQNEVEKIYLQLLPTPFLLCGNGVLDAGEECDDGNHEDRDGCTNGCTCARCGDGILHVFDAPPANGMCPAAPVEECDDGNITPGDGCSATCTRE